MIFFGLSIFLKTFKFNINIILLLIKLKKVIIYIKIKFLKSFIKCFKKMKYLTFHIGIKLVN